MTEEPNQPEAKAPPVDPPLTLTQMGDLLGSILLMTENANGAPAREAFVHLTATQIHGLRRVHKLLVAITPYAAEVRRLTVDLPKPKS